MKRVLLVEDDELIAELERDFLEASNFQVEIELDGDRGLKKALRGDYDALILDVMLPGENGFEICREVRRSLNLPVIMVTAKKEDVDKIREMCIRDRLDIAAVGNLLYNEAMLVESGMGAVLCIQLNCTYENLRFIPLDPVIESRTALVWKKDAIFSPATEAFIEFAAQYLKGIS